jgi:hypothetical protein
MLARIARTTPKPVQNFKINVPSPVVNTQLRYNATKNNQSKKNLEETSGLEYPPEKVNHYYIHRPFVWWKRPM